MKVIIAGGGIGGVITALCLNNKGIKDVSIYERASRITEIGAGIQISPNAAKVLHALGLAAPLEAASFRPEAIEMRLGRSNTDICRIPIKDEFLQRHAAPYYHIHRADLIDILVNALTPTAREAIHLNHEVVDYKTSASGVEVTFKNGKTERADVLIGADGIHSAIREAMLGSDTPRFTGNVAWRLAAPATPELHQLIPKTACIWAGPGKHAATYWVRGGDWVNFVGVVEQDHWNDEGWTLQGSREELIADFGDWSKPIRAIIDIADDIHKWALFDREPLSQWIEGRAALLGDACHPMLPFMAQGAAMAIEDAWVLSESLAAIDPVEKALLRYEERRRERAAAIQRGSRENMFTFHRRSALQQLSAYAPLWLAARIVPDKFRKRYDWIYRHDVVTA